MPPPGLGPEVPTPQMLIAQAQASSSRKGATDMDSAFVVGPKHNPRYGNAVDAQFFKQDSASFVKKAMNGAFGAQNVASVGARNKRRRGGGGGGGRKKERKYESVRGVACSDSQLVLVPPCLGRLIIVFFFFIFSSAKSTTTRTEKRRPGEPVIPLAVNQIHC